MDDRETRTFSAPGGGYTPGERQAQPEIPRIDLKNDRMDKMSRVAILETASQLITGDRADSYGDFGEQMRAISRTFEGVTGRELPPQDVALVLMILKLRRATTSPDQDSLVDLCGYAALYGEYFK